MFMLRSMNIDFIFAIVLCLLFCLKPRPYETFINFHKQKKLNYCVFICTYKPREKQSLNTEPLKVQGRIQEFPGEGKFRIQIY